MDDRSAKINIGGREFELILTTRATKEIAGRYGGLENLGQKLMRSENFEMALDELVWLITLLANQSVHPQSPHPGGQAGASHAGDGRAAHKPAGTGRVQIRHHGGHVQGNEAECGKREQFKKRTSRVTDEELFTRLFYYGTAQLHLPSEEVWLTPFGFLLDLWECHRQFLGMAKPKRELSIDDIIPPGL